MGNKERVRAARVGAHARGLVRGGGCVCVYRRALALCVCARESARTRGARAQNRSEEKKGRVEREGLHLPTLKKTTSCVTQNPLRLGPNQSLAGSGVTALCHRACFLLSPQRPHQLPPLG